MAIKYAVIQMLAVIAADIQTDHKLKKYDTEN
jgi:hypothetical protein